MDGPIEPDETAEPSDLLLKRGFTVHRLRENQPAINQPSQDTIPGAGSGDEE